MIGLLYLGFFAVYLWLSISLTKWAMKKAKSRGVKGWKYGLPVALVMYHLVFWDWLPTMVAHKYYCATEANFTVYKTLDEWKVENPGVAGTLNEIIQAPRQMPYGSLQLLDERFAIKTYKEKPVPLLSTVVSNRIVVDRKTNDVMAKGIDVGSGYRSFETGGSYKIWLKQKPCINKDIWKYVSEINNMREGKRAPYKSLM